MVDAHAVLDMLDRAVVVTDPSGQIVFWNRAAERLYGWTQHEVLGRSVLEVLAPVDQGDENAADLASIANGSPASVDRLVKGRNGNLILVHAFATALLDQHGATVAIVGSSEDVGDRRMAEQQLRDLTEHFRAALDAGGLGTWRWDMATGETVWDERLKALFGASDFDGTCERYVSLLHPDDRDFVLADLADAVRTKSSYRIEHRVVWPDGSVRWVAVVGGVTLDSQGEVTGSVGCSMDITYRVEQDQEVQRLAEDAVRAADNERLQRERLEFLAQINEALNASSTVREVMDNVASRVVPQLGDWCVIHVMPTDGRQTPEIAVDHVKPEMAGYARELLERIPFDPDAVAGVAEVIRTGTTQFSPELSDDFLESVEVSDEVRQLVNRLDLGSVITVAMKKRGRVVGALQFIATTHSRRYTVDDVALAETLAGRVASSIENLRLNEHQRLIAQTLQRSLLPASLPEIPGIDSAVRYWPNGEAAEVGGDFYDLFELERDNRFAVVLGDVCGTGPTAAAFTGLARHTIRDSAWHGDEHEAVLGSLNRAMRRSGEQTFLTCLYATVEPVANGAAITFACAGHPLPVHVGRNGSTTIGTPGTLLGVLDEIVVHPTTVTLEAGDVLVFHTDGATDLPPPHHLHEHQWAELVSKAVKNAESAAQIADRIRNALEKILPFTSRDDDIALLVLAVGQPSAT